MDLIPEAQAQTAEAAKAAADAGGILLQYQVLGAACVLLVIAVAALFWFLLQSWREKAALVERIVTTAVQSKEAADDNTEATKAVTTAVGALATAVQALDREAEGEARDLRHAVNNLASIIQACVKVLEEVRGRLERLERGRE